MYLARKVRRRLLEKSDNVHQTSEESAASRIRGGYVSDLRRTRRLLAALAFSHRESNEITLKNKRGFARCPYHACGVRRASSRLALPTVSGSVTLKIPRCRLVRRVDRVGIHPAWFNPGVHWEGPRFPSRPPREEDPQQKADEGQRAVEPWGGIVPHTAQHRGVWIVCGNQRGEK